MWFALTQGSHRLVRLVDEQSIWPAPDGTDSELIVRTETELVQEILLATPKMCRVRYGIKALAASMTLGDNPPAPWRDASRIVGRHFEILLTDRGPMIAPGEGEGRLPPRLASWQEMVVESMRSCWPVPPDDMQTGQEWTAGLTLPGGLPPHTRAAKLKVRYRAEDVREDRAAVEVRFGMRAVIKPPTAAQPQQAEGRGELKVLLRKQGGFARAERRGVMEIIRPSAIRNQLIRSRMRAEGKGG